MNCYLWCSLHFLLTAALFVCGKQPSEDEQTRVTVKTSRGLIRGFHVNNEALKNIYQGEGDVFLGIPYAVPPIGEKRFLKSELHGRYDDVVEANRYGKICPQAGGEVHSELYDTGMGEDCLTLNVFAPNASDHTNVYPVMVYIHGGALKFGDAAEWRYHGIISNIVRRGVVWVSINYRVGMLGFFTTFSKEFPPNRGIWDQVTALQWIQQEISSFGGDPGKVTLIGHSAGACSASSLAQSSAFDPSLFHRIILQSSAAEICFDKMYGTFTQSFDRSEQICGVNARDQGWTQENINLVKNCLSKLDYTQLNSYESKTFRWNTVIDGELFVDVPSRMKWRNIPVLMGSTVDEFALYTLWSLATKKTRLENYTQSKTEEEIERWVKALFGEQSVGPVIQAIGAEYGKPGNEHNYVEQIKYVTRVLSDLIYIRAVGEEAIARVESGNRNVWLWQIAFNTDYFTFFPLEGYKPVFHGIELFLLMQPDHAWVEGDQPDRIGAAEIAASDKIAEEFTNFAKYGKPSELWERLNLQRMNYWKVDGHLVIEEKEEEQYVEGYGGKHFAFWRKMAAEIKNGRNDTIISDSFTAKKSNDFLPRADL